MLSSNDIINLANLLKSKNDNEDSESDDDLPKRGLSRVGPGDIGPTKKRNPPKKSEKMKISVDGGEDESGGGGDTGQQDDEKAIWCVDEVAEVDDMDDPRPQPRYEMTYRQAVGTEDVFLQLGGRTPASASCEDLVVTVWLPGDRRPDVDVQVREARLDVRSPRHRLSLALPQPVDPQQSAATWDPDQEALTLRLRMVREFDNLNF